MRLSLTGRWSTGAWRTVVSGVGSVGAGSVWIDGFVATTMQRSLYRTTPLRRSMYATSTAAERGQVPEREAPRPSKKFWRVRPQGEAPTITTRQKFLRADPGLEVVELGWNWLRLSALAATPRTAHRRHAPLGYKSVKVGHLTSCSSL